MFVQTAGGTVVRDRIIPSDPKTQVQMLQRLRMQQASAAWSELDDADIDAWRDYAQTLGVRDPRTGVVRAPRPMNVFVSLAVKVLAVDPQAAIPSLPPSEAFLGDSVEVSIASVPGGVEFTASAANGADVVTELLLQPLVSRHRRTYVRAYRSQQFVAFSSGQTVLVPCAPGWVACAIRFVRPSTGQETGLAELGKALAF